jgi:hypothetical protein
MWLVKVLPLVPKESKVILLGDAEYDTTEMLSWVKNETSWHFSMHTSPSILVKNGVDWEKIRNFTVRQGRLRMLPTVGFTKTASFPANLVVWWGEEYEEPIYLITNLPNGSHACWYYRKRFRIETFFSDQKSRGFHIHKSHLSDPKRISRLLIAACLAYIWIVSLGLLTLSSEKHKLIDRTDRVDKSIFRLGIDWLKYVLKKGEPFEVFFLFQPNRFA